MPVGVSITLLLRKGSLHAFKCMQVAVMVGETE
jgi:hypothetical protein